MRGSSSGGRAAMGRITASPLRDVTTLPNCFPFTRRCRRGGRRTAPCRPARGRSFLHRDLEIGAHAHRPSRPAELVGQFAGAAEPGPRASAPSLEPTAISPRTSRPSVRAGRRPPARCPIGGQPPFWSSPDTFTCTSTAAPGARLAISCPSSQTVDPLPQVRRRGGQTPHLVALQPADEVPPHGPRLRPHGAPPWPASSWA